MVKIGKHQHEESGASNTLTTDRQLAASQETGTRRFLGLGERGGAYGVRIDLGLLRYAWAYWGGPPNGEPLAGGPPGTNMEFAVHGIPLPRQETV